MALRYRTMWISDVHLGTKASRAPELLKFLTSVHADKIYLVGDIVDLERMKWRPAFPDAHMAVVAELARQAANGTEVIYIPGNHDHEFRQAAGTEVLGIPIVLEAMHTTPCGRRLLVAHGDELDGRIRQGTNLEKFGAAAYFLLTEADILINRFRRLLGQDYFSLSANIKQRLASANQFIQLFETVATEYAAERGFDGNVCGHIHRPCMRRIGEHLDLNDGDWVEHSTALTEADDGTLQILNWRTGSVHVALAGGTQELLAA